MNSLVRRYDALLRTQWDADRGRTVLHFLLGTISRVLPIFAALAAKASITAVLDDDTTGAVVAAAALGATIAVSFALVRINGHVSAILIEKTSERYDREILRLSTSIAGIEHMENPEYLDQLEQLRLRPQALAQDGSFTSMVVWAPLQIGLVVVLLVGVSPVLLLLPIAAIVSIWLVRRAEHLRYAAFDAGAQHRRVATDFFAAATATERADEVRALRLEQTLVDRHFDAWQRAESRWRPAERATLGFDLASSLLFAGAYVAALVYVVEDGINGAASPGDVVLTVIIAGMLNQQLSALLDSFGRFLGALKLVDRYLWLVDYAAQHRAPDAGAPVPARLHDGIRLDDVHFAYPGTDSEVIHGVSVELPAGAIVALVGDNGAGKTTLVKLLTGMYTPTAGAITVDDRALVDLDVEEWRARTSAAFQDFARLEFSLQESIGVGDLEAVDDEAAVLAALDRAGAAELPTAIDAGLAAHLGSSFPDGTYLSGGQWQKVALGRAMMRTTPLLLVLDEPTASLDPTSERDLFTRYSRHARATGASAGTITLLISHRFSTVRMADLILVLDDGRITERGTHDELVGAGGTYAELYELQARSYR